MKKIIGVLLMLSLTACLVFAMATSVSAATAVSQDGLEVTILTDKDSYEVGEEVSLSVSIQNVGAFDVENVSIHTLLPEGLIARAGDLNVNNVSIAAGQTYRTNLLTLAVEPGSIPEEPAEPDDDGANSPETGVVSYTIVCCVVLIAAAIGVMLTIKKKTFVKMLSVFLCVALVLPCAVLCSRAGSTEEMTVITVDKTVEIGGVPYVLRANVSYSRGEEQPVFAVCFNSNGGSGIATQSIVAGGTAIEPEMPVREHHRFCGWYIDNGSFETAYDFTAPVTADITLYAKWESVAEGEIVGTDNEVSIYAITNLVVDAEGNTATATVSAPANCAVVIRFVEEDVYFGKDFAQNRTYINDGKTFASHVVPAGANNQKVEATINHLLPEYFVAEAILINENGDLLCNPYSSIEHTERYKAFDAKTVEDFPEDKVVLNFDEQLDDNFGVLADDVKKIEAENVYSEDLDGDLEEDIYKVLNPSEEIYVMDKIYVVDADSQHLFKVQSIQSVGEFLVMVPARADDEFYGFGLKDFYSFLKVNMGYHSDEEVNPDDTEEPMPLHRRKETRGTKRHTVSENDTKSCEIPLVCRGIETEHFSATASVKASIKATIIFQWDAALFADDYIRCDFTFEVDGTAELEVQAKIGGDVNTEEKKEEGEAKEEDKGDKKDKEEEKSSREEREISIGKVRIPFGITGLSAFVDPKIKVQWELSAGLIASGHIVSTNGFTYNTIDGINKVEKKDNYWEVKCYGKAEVKVGLCPSIGIDFLDKVLEVEIECFMGAKFTAVVSVPLAQGGDHKHACHLCVEGTLSACISVDVKGSFHITKRLKGVMFNQNIINFEKKLFNFYVSIINAPDSSYGGQLTVGKGECENKVYKTTFAIEGIDDVLPIDIYTQTQTLRETVNSNERVYLPQGSYVAKVVVDGKTIEKAFSVADGAKHVVLSSTPVETGCVSGRVVDAITQEPVAGAKVELFEHTTRIAETVTDADGNFRIPTEQGSYKLAISTEGYIGIEHGFTVREGEQKELGAIALVLNQSDRIMGGIYGTIKDALTGEEVEDVNVSIQKGWGTDAGDAWVVESLTDEHGAYHYKKRNTFGVDFGLDAGNYTISISKDGYIATSFNITIVGGMDMEFNSSITPVGAENTYHIVLTWGEHPQDLDSHLNGMSDSGYHDHIYYAERDGRFSWLDVDDTTSYGPETITIPDLSAYRGNVMYSVHDYSNRDNRDSQSLSSSMATVKVYRGGQLLETFNVPSGKEGTVWHVFYIDEAGEIHAVNTFEHQSDADAILGQAA